MLGCPEKFASKTPLLGFSDIRTLSPLEFDPPQHSLPRHAVDTMLRRCSKEAVPFMEKHASTLIDRFVDRGSADLCEEFSLHFPAGVLLKVLGFPQEDLPFILAMKQKLYDPGASTAAEQEAQRRQASRDIDDYCADALDQRVRQPRQDGVTTLQDTQYEGRRLTRAEVMDVLFFLLLAGFDTVAGTLEGSFAYLAQHPDQRRRLAGDSDVIPAATEELLRCFGGVLAVHRTALESAPVGERTMAQGDTLAISLVKANRDEGVFADAQRVDFSRRPNRHVAFGAGVHRCPGAGLARLELHAALTVWHGRIPEYRLAGDPSFYELPSIRRFVHLPLAWA